MFVEPVYRSQRHGWIEVICGSMFSGKTEELIRRIKRARYARMKVEVFKPRIDSRYSHSEVVSHDEHAIKSTVIDRAIEVMNVATDVRTIAIDEAQFFDEHLVDVCQELAVEGRRVIVAGLDMDYKGAPFGPMPRLLAIAEHVTKVHAICVHCGSLASHSYRRTSEDKQVLLGEKEAYEPRCRRCFTAGQKIDFHQAADHSAPPKLPNLFDGEDVDG